MKTLDALNAELTVEIEARCKRVTNSNLANLLSPAELQAFYRQNVVNEKFMELWEIVTLLDSYFQKSTLDGNPERRETRKQLREMLDKI
jgi:hypothetical protein